MTAQNELNPTARYLMGPGPSDVHPRVLKAMATPMIGHLDPQFIEIMDGLMEMLRQLFRTKNPLTFAVSATGSAGMETCFVNLLEPGDEALVCVNGVFGNRMSDIVERCGARLVRVDAPWGQPVDPDAVRKALKGSKLSMVRNYWSGAKRLYHHTAPISMIYALYEALRLILEEGVERRFERHRRNHELLRDGLEDMGFEYIPAPAYRLPMLNAVKIPSGYDDARIRSRLLSEYNIEIGGGLGDFAGKAWRIGLMGYSCTENHVNMLLAALRRIMKTG
jgi:aspartate aminotransferase-like enzyme